MFGAGVNNQLPQLLITETYAWHDRRGGELLGDDDYDEPDTNNLSLGDTLFGENGRIPLNPMAKCYRVPGISRTTSSILPPGRSLVSGCRPRSCWMPGGDLGHYVQCGNGNRLSRCGAYTHGIGGYYPSGSH